MMSHEVISFFDCAPASREDQFSVMPAVVEETTITVKRTAQTAYRYVEKAARRFTRWITVTAELVRRTVVRAFCARFRNVFRMTGVQILRRCAILRI